VYRVLSSPSVSTEAFVVSSDTFLGGKERLKSACHGPLVALFFLQGHRQSLNRDVEYLFWLEFPFVSSH